MIVIHNGRRLRAAKGPVLTLGNFDGLHFGHRKIINKVVERAKALGCPSAVYTFEPHPLKVVAPHKSPPLIADLDDKKRLFEEAGVDFLILAKFTKAFAATHPREFVKDVLVKGLSVREVWVGHDFSFGRSRLGTVDYMKELGAEFGFKVNVIPAYKKAGMIVSSSRIRGLITEGDVRSAARLLGRFYAVKGRVVRGKAIGKGIGFPTANLKVTSELVPKNGVYAAVAVVEGKKHKAVVNIGTAPTFGGKKRSVEVHIMDFEDNIYGKKMEALLVRRLRDEKAFKSKEALIKQIKRDVERAKKILYRAK